MTDELVFVDTNVLIYAYDRSAGHKRSIARSRLADLWETHTGVLSAQVLQEFYVNVTRKLARPLSAVRARHIVTDYASWPMHLVEATDIIRASEVEQRHGISFWDALVVVAASRLGAARLLTEDLGHGQVIAGVRIENPFVAAGS
ncbi:MAG TPA: PIN domain-containing protein [Candidatus Limnocylindrales bacterium]|nr:PIN domain-containing protein [Candidatus Limnocylindrales bacterium]